MRSFDFSNATGIGLHSFCDCGLEEICIKPNIQFVEAWAFHNCKNLKNVEWLSDCEIPALCFYITPNLKSFDFFHVKKNGNSAFVGSGLIEVYLGKNIKQVGEAAFDHSHELKSVAWMCDCSIPDLCFAHCYSLSTAMISESVKCIESLAFLNTKVEIMFV